MVKIENNCVGCATESYPCLGDSCKYRNVPHYYCNRCGEEEQLYYYDDEELCLECIEKLLKKVEYRD